ncbi:MAG TPA: hypothetical protein VD908_05290 [Cytophagales bacterium]|nr:hypothetical protein [Cytophagales bacterium]
MKKPFNYFFLILFVALFNCGKTERVDTESVKDAMKSREIKKVSDAEIIEKGLKKGKEDFRLLLECINKNQQKSRSYAQCLIPERSSMIDTLKIFIPGSSPGDFKKVEKELIEAYQYTFSQNQSLHPNIQDLDNDLILYTAPFFTSAADGKFYEEETKDEKPQSFGIAFIFYSKRQLILDL